MTTLRTTSDIINLNSKKYIPVNEHILFRWDKDILKNTTLFYFFYHWHKSSLETNFLVEAMGWGCLGRGQGVGKGFPQPFCSYPQLEAKCKVQYSKAQ